MKNTEMFTVTGDYWHFHPIGTGTIFTYHVKAQQVLITCNATGKLLNVIDVHKEDGFKSSNDFREEAKKLYLNMILHGATLELDFYENTKFVGAGMVEVDFELLKN